MNPKYEYAAAGKTISHLPQKHPKNHQHQRQHPDTRCGGRPSFKRSAKILYAKRADSIEALAQEIKANRDFSHVGMQSLLITKRDAEIFMDCKHRDQPNKRAIKPVRRLKHNQQHHRHQHQPR